MDFSMGPSVTQAEQQIEKVEFSKETYELISRFSLIGTGFAK